MYFNANRTTSTEVDKPTFDGNILRTPSQRVPRQCFWFPHVNHLLLEGVVVVVFQHPRPQHARTLVDGFLRRPFLIRVKRVRCNRRLCRATFDGSNISRVIGPIGLRDHDNRHHCHHYRSIEGITDNQNDATRRCVRSGTKYGHENRASLICRSVLIDDLTK